MRINCRKELIGAAKVGESNKKNKKNRFILDEAVVNRWFDKG
jgi:hypothetical protein